MFHRFGDLSTSSRSGNWVFADEDVPFSSQLTQRLHNRLSSLATLIDHTRRVMRGTEVDLAIREAYEEQVLMRLRGVAVRGDSEGLRNYMLRYSPRGVIRRSRPIVLARSASRA
jgi:hypothetical protein